MANIALDPPILASGAAPRGDVRAAAKMRARLPNWATMKTILAFWAFYFVINTIRMAAVDAEHLFFTIWAATQTYADFDVQVRAVLGRSKLLARDHQRATDHVVALILRGCGLG